jgi:hypothetical protein
MTPRLWRETYLTEESSAARLDSLDLGSVEGSAVEASRKLGKVKGNTLGGIDRAQRGSAGTAEARLLKRTVLLDVVAVGAEVLVGSGGIAVSVAGPGLGELLGTRGGVRLGGVVDVGRDGSGTKELDERGSLSVDSSLSEGTSSREHGGGCICVEVIGIWSGCLWVNRVCLLRREMPVDISKELKVKKSN